jgi:hypothetical protein
MPEGKSGRMLRPVVSLLRVHLMPQWLTLSDPTMEEAQHDRPLLRDLGLSRTTNECDHDAEFH